MQKLYNETNIQNIANSIRNKNGLSTTYKVSEMSTAINNLKCITNKTLTGTTNNEYTFTALNTPPKIDLDGNSHQETTTGKNLLPNNATTQAISGVTFTKNSDGTIIANGTATAGFNFYINEGFYLEPGTYTISDDTPNPSDTTYFTYADTMSIGTRGAVTKTITSKILESARIVIRSGAVLNNIIFKPMISTTGGEYEPYTGGQPSPNPDYPQEIEVVETYNLFNQVVRQGGISGAGVDTESSDRIKTDILYLPAGTYTVNCIGEVNINYHIYSLNGVWERLGNTIWQNNPHTFTLTEGKGVRFTFKKITDEDITPTDISNLQLVKGTQPQPYMPYNNIGIKVRGKNLFDIKNFTKSGWNAFILNPIKNMPVGQYTISCVNYLDNNNTGMAVRFANTIGGGEGLYFVGYTFGKSIKSNTQTLTTTEMNAEYMVLMPENNALTQTMVENMKIQIEQGSTATEYESYIEQITPIPLNNNFIAKLPKGTQDELSIDKNGNISLLKKIGKVVLDGSESWVIDGTLTDTIRFRTPIFSGSIGQSYTKHTISNYFIFLVNYNSDTSHYYIGDTNSFFFVQKTTATTLQELKSWLSTHNTEVYYELETPQTINLGRIPTPLLNGTNNFTILTNLDTNFNMEYNDII